ncbi:MAG: sugar kinase [Planctomycetales bacterium]|nr:sugar kinase [Planctomycetales bacterium]
MSTIVTFGEVMGRLNPPGFQRLRQCLPGSLQLTFAGAEANVAVSLALLGGQSRFVTALPQNPLADACISTLRGLGVDTRSIVRMDEGRLGLYFVEAGANQRASQVVYDRAGSSISLAPATAYAWREILADAAWLHLTGITPSISEAAAASTLAAAQTAKELGLVVSCDLNFRAKLWRWREGVKPKELAEQTMRQLLPLVDLVVANEADCSDVLQIRAEGTDVDAGQLSVDRYPQVAEQLIQQFPNVSRVAITLRESHSASHNDWGGMLYERDNSHAYFAPMSDGEYSPYPIKNMVDRVGAGDSFAAGLIFALTTPELSDPHTALQFAVAASCLAHSIEGDFNYSTRGEIEALMGGSTAGRVIR